VSVAFAALWALFGSVALAAVPPGFQDTVVFSGLTAPTAVAFSPDGRVFVAEKSGRIVVFDDLNDSTPTQLIDISPNVHDMWDRGLLGLRLDPNFPASPYLYMVYTYDYDPATPQFPAPRWGDTCPDPPGATGDGCVATGRLSRLQVTPANTVSGGEQVILENNWCIQSVTHTIGDIVFDDDGALIVGGGDGAEYTLVDFGQIGGSAGSPVPRNPCGDPPGGRGGAMSSPTAEGGALRAQDIRTSGDPQTWDGALLRIDPATGAAWPDNPLAGGANSEDDRIIAYGLRNPFRFTMRPGTHELWLGDVGWNDYEEINRILSAHDPLVENFGWPCYEGAGHQSGYDAANLDLCESLYGAGPTAVVPPYFQYQHGTGVTPAPDDCNNGSSAVSGLAFYPSGNYPASYHGALFFADYGRGCMYVLPQGGDGNPDPAQRQVFLHGDIPVVDLELGPQGDLFYVNVASGEVHRISYTAGNQPPIAVAQATPSSGPLPLLVNFSAAASSDPDPETVLTYAWDLDGDGQYDDSTSATPQRTYDTAGPVTIRLQVDDGDGSTDTDALVIQPGNNAPAASITSPSVSLQWKVGDPIAFSGGGTDTEDVTIPAERMHWDVILHHCPGGTAQCHSHVAESYDGVSGGSFTAPDHDWYAYLEFKLRVTDAGGLVSEVSRNVQPQSVVDHFDTVPSGLELVVAGIPETTPFDRSAIVGSTITMSAEIAQTLGNVPYRWVSWSNDGPATQDITIAPFSQSYTANFVNDRILVVVAHPDDDVLIAGGVIRRAVQDGTQVQVVYVTNGDAQGEAVGITRQGEAVDAQSVLGLAEDNLIFLGYSDGSLAEMVTTCPNAGQQCTGNNGRTTTYGQRGLGSADYHTYRFGSPAQYNGYELIGDLSDILTQYRPAHVITLSEWDAISSHTIVYDVVNQALGQVFAQDPTYQPTLHSTIIWADPPSQEPVWPELANPAADFTEPPHLAQTSLVWNDRASLQVPLDMQLAVLASNKKWLSIDEHQSQGGAAPPSVLGRFVHKDEIFWSENPLGMNQPPVPNAGPDQVAANGAQVTLDGTLSRDPENGPLSFRWVQVAGASVTLSSATASQPVFTAPLTGVGQVLMFELRVNDGTFESLADCVTVKVLGPVNIAPVATASASSETTETGQTAAKAIDGVISGYPVDFTKEWATNGQGAGAWIQLNWSRPYCVQEVVLYDRPNGGDNVTAGSLLFSDSSTLPVGALDDAAEAGTILSFADRIVTSVRFTIAAVSATTENVGLAEFEVYRCVEADFDNDDWFVSEGDCDDGNALRNPGLTEIPYNNRDDDCNPATLDSDLDGDGYNVPEDCDDTEPTAHPGATEIPYNGIDEDCDSLTPDNDLDQDGYGNELDCNDQSPTVHHAPFESQGVRVDTVGSATRITWNSQSSIAGASTVYDVFSGSLIPLVSSGNYTTAVCLISNLTVTQRDDTRVPAEGETYYYLVIGKNSCGRGTVGNSSIAPDPRDYLDASPPCGGSLGQSGGGSWTPIFSAAP